MFKTKTGYIYLIPVIVGFSIFFIIPFIIGLYFCFFSTVDGNFIGFQGFAVIFASEAFLLAAKNTIIVMLTFIPALIILSFLISYFIYYFVKKSNRLIKFIQSIIFLPYIMPSVTIIAFWKYLFDGYGGLNRALNYFLNIPGIDWYYGAYVYIPIFTIFIWKYSGINIIILFSSFCTVKTEIIESARIDGAGEIKILFNIILPSIFPQLFFIILISIISCFKLFREIYALCGDYPSKSVYMLQNYINNNIIKYEYTKVTCASYLFIIFIIIFTLFLFRIEKKWRQEN